MCCKVGPAPACIEHGQLGAGSRRVRQPAPPPPASRRRCRCRQQQTHPAASALPQVGAMPGTSHLPPFEAYNDDDPVAFYLSGNVRTELEEGADSVFLCEGR